MDVFELVGVGFADGEGIIAVGLFWIGHDNGDSISRLRCVPAGAGAPRGWRSSQKDDPEPAGFGARAAQPDASRRGGDRGPGCGPAERQSAERDEAASFNDALMTVPGTAGMAVGPKIERGQYTDIAG
jgi:hypothetical protein